MSRLSSNISGKISALVDAIGSQERFAHYAGVSQGIVSRWMAGTAAPSKKTRMKISAALGVSYQLLLDDSAPLSEETLHAIQQRRIVDIQLEGEAAAATQAHRTGRATAGSGSSGIAGVRKRGGEATACASFEKLAQYHFKLLTDVAGHPFGRLIMRPSLVEESLGFFMEAAKESRAAGANAAARNEGVHGIIRLLKSFQSEAYSKKPDEGMEAVLALAQNRQAVQMQELIKRLEKVEGKKS